MGRRAIGLRTGIVALLLTVALVIVTAAMVVSPEGRIQGIALLKGPPPLRVGAAKTVDTNDVGDPFVFPVPAGTNPPAFVPYQTGPEPYINAPWTAATANFAKAHGWYVLFGTTDWQENVPTAVSVDLTHWTEAPDALPQLPSWAKPSISMTWGPSALRTNADWILYFSTEDKAYQRECIGAAISSTPAGPYVDNSSSPLVCQPSLGGSIDPSIVHAPDGTPFLIWKNDGNSADEPDVLWSEQLRSDGLSLVGTAHKLLGATESWERGIVEAPAMLPSSYGGYWLFFAGGNWRSNRYDTGVAFCQSVTGPCATTSAKPFLATTRSLISPAGLDTFVDHQGRLWAGFTALVLVPSTWRPGHYFYNRVLDIAPIETR